MGRLQRNQELGDIGIELYDSNVRYTRRVTGTILEISSFRIISNGFCLCIGKSDAKVNFNDVSIDEESGDCVHKQPLHKNYLKQIVARSAVQKNYSVQTWVLCFEIIQDCKTYVQFPSMLAVCTF